MAYVTSSDGTRIAYDRDGAGHPLLLVHGTAAARTAWTAIRPLLEEHFRVYAMDRRGRGESEDGDGYDIGLEFEDIATVLESIGEPVHLFGHSYGATCALGASARTSSIRRMILYEPPLWTPGEALAPEDPLATLDEAVSRGDDEQVLETFFEDVARAGERLAYYRTLPTWTDRLDAASTIPREVRATGSYRPDAAAFADVTTPTRVLLGDQTGGHLPAGTRAAHEYLSNSELIELDGLGHAGISSAPERIAELTSEFLLDG